MKAEPVNGLDDRTMRIRMPKGGTKPWVGIRQLISPRRIAIAVIAEEDLKWAAPNGHEVPLILGKLEKFEHEPRSAKRIQVRLHEFEDLPLNVDVVTVGHRVVVRIGTQVKPLVRQPSRGEDLI